MDHSKSLIDQIEEMLIAGILGAMTLITFANVVTRYGFNKNILWALELTVFLFYQAFGSFLLACFHVLF
mgnify:CR=1 FL=1